MSARLLIAPEVSLPSLLPAQLPPPKFQLDQTPGKVAGGYLLIKLRGFGWD
jgi:hypothetical protein